MIPKALIVEDNYNHRKTLAYILEKNHISYDEAESVRDAISKIQENEYGLLLLDMVLQTNDINDGITILEFMEKKKKLIPTIVISRAITLPKVISKVYMFSFVIWHIEKQYLKVLEDTLNKKIVEIFKQQDDRNRIKRENLVFISYTHKDKRWLERLQVHLKPLEREGSITIWDDTLIRTGSKWKEEIKSALNFCKAAVLLISADFIASDFISKNELPPLLIAARKKGIKILPLIISSSRFEQIDSISQFQSVNPPSQPLIKMSKGKQEEILYKLALEIESTFLS